MKLPPLFIQTVERTFGDRGRFFLHALPALIEEAAKRWLLSDIRLAEHLSYNFIAYARSDEADVVLKLGVPDRELTSEVRSLRGFAGRGAVRLLDSDSGRGMLLLERLRPGQQLAVLDDDARATHIAAEIMQALRHPTPPEAGLIQLSDWLEGFERLRGRFDGGTGPLDRGLFVVAEAVAHDLLAEDHLPALIHGDLHHFNILSSERGWLAIDPKGVVGPAAYEAGPFLINPWIVSGRRPETQRLIEQRIAILSEQLGFEKQRLRQWGLAHAMLSAVWSVEENGNWRNAMECAGIFADP